MFHVSFFHFVRQVAQLEQFDEELYKVSGGITIYKRKLLFLFVNSNHSVELMWYEYGIILKSHPRTITVCAPTLTTQTILYIHTLHSHYIHHFYTGERRCGRGRRQVPDCYLRAAYLRRPRKRVDGGEESAHPLLG